MNSGVMSGLTMISCHGNAGRIMPCGWRGALSYPWPMRTRGGLGCLEWPGFWFLDPLWDMGHWGQPACQHKHKAQRARSESEGVRLQTVGGGERGGACGLWAQSDTGAKAREQSLIRQSSRSAARIRSVAKWGGGGCNCGPHQMGVTTWNLGEPTHLPAR